MEKVSVNWDEIAETFANLSKTEQTALAMKLGIDEMVALEAAMTRRIQNVIFAKPAANLTERIRAARERAQRS